MPVETLVIVPTSRGVSCGAKALARLADSGERAVEDALQDFRRCVHVLVGVGCRLGPSLQVWLRFVLLLQKLADALFQRREIIRDAPGHLLSVRGEFDPADQVRRGLEADVDVGREGFVERILDRRALLRRQVERAAHERGVGRRLEGRAEVCFRLAVHLAQAAR